VRTSIVLTAEAAKEIERENAAIARGLKAQDPELLDQLIETYQHRLMRYLMFLTNKREVAEDLFQEVWIRVLRRGSQYNGKARFDTWIFTIARNLVIDLSRKRTMASLDEMREGGEDDRPFEIAGAELSRGADAALPRGDVAGGDRQRDTRALVDCEVATVPRPGSVEARVVEAAFAAQVRPGDSGGTAVSSSRLPTNPSKMSGNGNARAAIVNRTHRVIRAEALTLREQKTKSRSLWVPLVLFSSLMLVICYAIWTMLDSYDLVPNGVPDASDQMILFLMWSLPVTALIVGLVWFKRGRGRLGNSEVQS
jgi:RNA polymerase sigma factor (sigma-70 family)